MPMIMSSQFGEPQPPPYSTHPRPGQKTLETGPYPMAGAPPTAPPFAAYPPSSGVPPAYQGMNQYPTQGGYYPQGYPQPMPGAYPPQPGYGSGIPPPPGYYPPQTQPYGQPTYVMQERYIERGNSSDTEKCCLYALCGACLACCFLDALD